MSTYPKNTNSDAALRSFQRAQTSCDLLKIKIFEPLFNNTSKPFLPGDTVIADMVNFINPKLETRFYLVSKEDKKGLFFANITEHSECYSVLAEHETEPIKIKKDQLFEAVDVYEILYYEHLL